MAEALSQEAFSFLLILMRLLALVSVMPAIGDKTIPMQVRGGLAFALTILLLPIVSPSLPDPPARPFDIGIMLSYEFIIGLLIAGSARFLMSSVHVAGAIIAFQTGLASAQLFDPSQGIQSALVSSVLTILAVTLIFVTDTHHLMIMGFAHSYTLFPVGEALPVADFASLVMYFMASSFELGVQLAAPFLVYAFVFNLGLGLIAKMIPQFQVFFVGLPLNVYLGFALFAATLGSMLTLFMQRFQGNLLNVIG